MFTGLVEATGALRGREARGTGFRLTFDAALPGYEVGESIAVSGTCLTVVDPDAHGFCADISSETVEKTTLGLLALGAAVNLERSLRVGDRLGGHLVAGHVDGLGRVTKLTPAGEALHVEIDAPETLSRFIAVKGSITVDGVSLTVNAVAGACLEVMLVPHTRAVTTFGALAVGQEVNLEVDLVARYVARWLEQTDAGRPASDGATRDASLLHALRRAGMM